MDTSALLLELYGRIPTLAAEAVADLSPEQLLHRPTPTANPIGWLVWHTARVEDHQAAEVGGYQQVWITDGWAGRFGDPADPDDHGYAHTAAQVAGVRAERAADLLAYLDAAHQRTIEFLRGLSAADLDRIVDHNWDPPVTLGVRLISVADDCLQHLGQAAYVRGLLLG
ncbi:MAG TPA: DinB family protein [Sporichthyaceae bacterium]|nr:DinB family protein [Sporichthyaceae bacterium]